MANNLDTVIVMDKDILKVFIEDIKDKKKIANNIKYKTGKSGKIGKVIMPSDVTRFKKYEKNSKVVSYMLVDYKWDEVKSFPKEKKRELFVKWLKQDGLTIAKLAQLFGVTPEAVRQVALRAGVTSKGELREPYVPTPSNLSNKKSADNAAIEKLFTINLTGNFLGKELINKLETLPLILNDTEKYEVSLSIKSQ